MCLRAVRHDAPADRHASCLGAGRRPYLQAWRKLESWKSARTVNMQSPLESWQDRIGAHLQHHGPVPDPKESCSRRCLVHSHGSLLSPPYDIMQSEAHHRTECANEAARRLRGARHAWVVAPEHSHCKRKSDRLGDTAPTNPRQTTLRHVPIPEIVDFRAPKLEIFKVHVYDIMTGMCCPCQALSDLGGAHAPRLAL